MHRNDLLFPFVIFGRSYLLHYNICVCTNFAQSFITEVFYPSTC